MSRYAVISDIHGNRHALEAVLRAMARLDVDGVICLGDIVGYGPAPGPCIDLVTRYCDVIVQGNHDEAVVDFRRAAMFNGPARTAIEWTQDHLGPLHLSALNQLQPVAYIDHNVICVHDNPAPGPSDYVYDQFIAATSFGGFDRQICLIGHTHVPVVFEAPPGGETGARETRSGEAGAGRKAAGKDGAGKERLPADADTAPSGLDHDPLMQAVRPDQIRVIAPNHEKPIELAADCRYICNPGSVGQPRDADPRASFAILDTDGLTFTMIRCEYDIAAAQRDSQEAGLPGILAERLAVGA